MPHTLVQWEGCKGGLLTGGHLLRRCTKRGTGGRKLYQVHQTATVLSRLHLLEPAHLHQGGNRQRALSELEFTAHHRGDWQSLVEKNANSAAANVDHLRFDDR